MSKQAWTLGPWEINWFNCTANVSDVAYARSKGDAQLQVGHTFWRVARSIGPITIDSNHWSGDYLNVSEADARLIQHAPEMAEVLGRMDGALNCGCRPCRGDCTSDKAKAIAFDAVHDEARAILARIKGETGQ
jgi:hypothetical protein